METLGHDPHVVSRNIQVLRTVPEEVLQGLEASICAQDCYAKINPDQEDPSFEVTVTGEAYTLPLYTITMEISEDDQPIAMLQVTRDKSIV